MVLLLTISIVLKSQKKQESPGLSQDWRIPPPPIWTQRMSVFPNPIVDPPSRKPESMEVFRGCFTPIFQLPIRRPTPIVLSLRLPKPIADKFSTFPTKYPPVKANGTIQTELELDKTNGFIPVRMKQTCNIDNVKHFFTATRKISFDNDLIVNIELETIWKITKPEGVEQNALYKSIVKYSYDDIPLNEFQLSAFGYAEPSTPGGWSVPLYAWGIVSALFFGGVFVYMKRRGSR